MSSRPRDSYAQRFSKILSGIHIKIQNGIISTDGLIIGGSYTYLYILAKISSLIKLEEIAAQSFNSTLKHSPQPDDGDYHIDFQKPNDNFSKVFTKSFAMHYIAELDKARIHILNKYEKNSSIISTLINKKK